MDSRERTFLALDHQEPDRVPIDCWLSSGMKARIQRELNLSYDELLDRYDVDLRYIDGPRYVGKSRSTGTGSVDIDFWGVQRQEIRVGLGGQSSDAAESYNEVMVSPLERLRSVAEIGDYSWPSPDWFDYTDIERQCDAVRDRGRVVVFIGDRENRVAQLKPAMYLRGYEQIMVDMVESPEIAQEVFRRISGFYLEYGRRILEAANGKIDIFCTGDDFGAQNGPLISTEMWNDFLKDGFAQYIGLGRHYGARTMHHTCGSVSALVPTLIECGLDILQSLQPEAADMDPGVLKDRYGDRICFQGGISIQDVLPRGSADDVRNHARAVLETMMPGGGYIAGTSHNIQADSPVSNVLALFSAYHEFGIYNS